MRSIQQSKNRSRGRTGRKHGNPLTRNYESNGPDVKIRGNAGHIADKYVQLARDAQASGDSVMAENYFQHAEHYFRIISAAQSRSEQSGEKSAEQSEGSGEEVKAQASESAEGAAEKKADEVAAQDSGEAKEASRPRRPRRRKVSEAAAETEKKDTEAADPASSPQPEVGELPAFLTGSPQASAAE